MNDVKNIQYLSDYKYWIEFDDGVKGEIDFTVYFNRGPVFEKLKDINYFKRAKIEGGTICWPEGPDIAPESLYEKILEKTKKRLNKSTAL